MTPEPQRPAPPPPPPPPPPHPPGGPYAIAPYYQRPLYAPPPAGKTEGRVVMSLVLSLVGLLLAATGLVLGAVAVLTANGDLLNALLLGLAGLMLGPLSYFLARSGINRIAEAPGTLGGRSTAVAGWVLGAVATGIGAIVTLIWIVLLLVANFGPPPT